MELYKLVKSLSPAERRYFRIHAGQQARKADLQYEVLFDILLEMPEYSSAAERSSLKTRGITLRPSLLRAQLKSRILDAMRMFHRKRDVESELLQGLQDLAFLSDKKLNGLLKSEIRRLRKLAILHEHYHLLVPIDNYARRLHKETAKKHIKTGMEQILEEMQNHLDLLTNQLQFTHLLDLMFVFARRDLQLGDDSRSREIEELMANPLLDDPAMARTLTGKMYFHQLHAIYAQLQGKIALAAEHYAKVIGVWDAAPHFIRERPSIYRRTLGNYLSACHLLDDYSAFPETVQKIRNTPARSRTDEIEIFDLGYSFQILAWLGQDQLEAAEAAVPEIEMGLETYQGHMRPARIGHFRYNLAILFFILEKPSEAMRRFRLILEERHSGQREDLRRAVILLRLVLMLDKEDWDLLEYELRSASRYFAQEDRSNPLVETVLWYLNRRIKASSKAEGDELTRKLEERLGELRSVPTVMQQPGLPELVCWARSKTESIPIRKAAANLTD